MERRLYNTVQWGLMALLMHLTLALHAQADTLIYHKEIDYFIQQIETAYIDNGLDFEYAFEFEIDGSDTLYLFTVDDKQLRRQYNQDKYSYSLIEKGQLLSSCTYSRDNKTICFAAYEAGELVFQQMSYKKAKGVEEWQYEWRNGVKQMVYSKELIWGNKIRVKHYTGGQLLDQHTFLRSDSCGTNYWAPFDSRPGIIFFFLEGKVKNF